MLHKAQSLLQMLSKTFQVTSYVAIFHKAKKCQSNTVKPLICRAPGWRSVKFLQIQLNIQHSVL